MQIAFESEEDSKRVAKQLFEAASQPTSQEQNDRGIKPVDEKNDSGIELARSILQKVVVKP